MKPYLTIVIPTYNRSKHLKKCLERLQQQTLAQEAYEVIVVNDGSTDDTESMLNEMTLFWPSLRAIHQENAGQGNARNKAMPFVQGQIVMFIGDDIYATEDFLEQHVNFHKENPEKEFACLGLTEWEPSKKTNHYMNWLTDGGPQFAYHKLKPQQEASFWFFYTSNISLKTDLIQKQAFDPDFKGYGWEDIELGYRLEKEEGLKLIYNEKALAYHDHFMEEQDLKKRMRKVGSSSQIFQKKHPELKVIPKGFKKIALWLIGSWPSILLLSIFRIIFPNEGRKALWYALSKRYFLQGVRRVV